MSTENNMLRNLSNLARARKLRHDSLDVLPEKVLRKMPDKDKSALKEGAEQSSMQRPEPNDFLLLGK